MLALVRGLGCDSDGCDAGLSHCFPRSHAFTDRTRGEGPHSSPHPSAQGTQSHPALGPQGTFPPTRTRNSPPAAVGDHAPTPKSRRSFREPWEREAPSPTGQTSQRAVRTGEREGLGGCGCR